MESDYMSLFMSKSHYPSLIGYILSTMQTFIEGNELVAFRSCLARLDGLYTTRLPDSGAKRRTIPKILRDYFSPQPILQ